MMPGAALIWLCLTVGLAGGTLRVATPATALAGSSPLTGIAPAPVVFTDKLPADTQTVAAPTRVPPVPDRFVYHGRRDIAIAFAATAAWIVAAADESALVARNCKWCDRAPNGTDALNDLDSWGRRAMLWHNTGRAITASNLTAFVWAPAAAYGLDWMAASHDGRRSDAVPDAIVITESIAIASDLTDVIKYSVGRQRPFVHVLAPSATATTPQSADNNTSFPSGHTTLAFSLVTSSAAIAGLRGYSRTSWIWWAGLPAATLTAYFRVAADRHYVTDVMAGAAVGSAVGVLVPYLGHRRKTDHRIPSVRVMPTQGGRMVAAEWEW